jgi:hypothetical protein
MTPGTASILAVGADFFVEPASSLIRKEFRSVTLGTATILAVGADFYVEPASSLIRKEAPHNIGIIYLKPIV